MNYDRGLDVCNVEACTHPALIAQSLAVFFRDDGPSPCAVRPKATRINNVDLNHGSHIFRFGDAHRGRRNVASVRKTREPKLAGNNDLANIMPVYLLLRQIGDRPKWTLSLRFQSFKIIERHAEFFQVRVERFDATRFAARATDAALFVDVDQLRALRPIWFGDVATDKSNASLERFHFVTAWFV
ncbi:MAG TPA: hypothetical protein VKB78_08575 [Pirellulales bacterium]|nr:hypothetical protein [Pirellulales bacterium]